MNSEKNASELRFKPMAIDPLYWRIVGLEDNLKEPLSFRAWGAFCCDTLPICATELVGEAEGVAEKMVKWIDEQSKFLVTGINNSNFSAAILNHENQIERGAYAISLVVSLIEEGDIKEAKRLANLYAAGRLESVHKQNHLGKDFHQIALEWLESSASDV